jgi:hypothetical protein
MVSTELFTYLYSFVFYEVAIEWYYAANLWSLYNHLACKQNVTVGNDTDFCCTQISDTQDFH